MRRTVTLVSWAVLLGVAVLGAGCNSTWVSSGLLYQEQGNYKKAEQMFQQALWYDEEEAAAHYHLAYTLAYRAENDHLSDDEVDSARIKIGKAHEHYLLAAKYDPEKYQFNPDAENEEDRTPAENGIASMYARMFNKGVQLMNAERYDDAILYFELAGLADPRRERGFDAALLVAKLRYNKVTSTESTDEAELQSILTSLNGITVGDDWEDAGAKKADLAQTQAQVYRSLGRDEEASRLYEALLANNPSDLSLLQRVAEARSNSGDHAGAGELYGKALDVAVADAELTDEDRYSLAFRAALAYREGELYDQTIAYSDRALEYAGTSSQRSSASRIKARACYELERWDAALGAIEPVVVDGGFDPNNVEAWQIYYLALNKAGRLDESMKARERFIALRDGGR